MTPERRGEMNIDDVELEAFQAFKTSDNMIWRRKDLAMIWQRWLVIRRTFGIPPDQQHPVTTPTLFSRALMEMLRDADKLEGKGADDEQDNGGRGSG
jgi:hypothetical protein